MMALFFTYDFFAPQWLWFLIGVPIFLCWMWYSDKRKLGDWKYTGGEKDQKRYGTWYIQLIRKVLIINASFMLVLLILAMAKPYDWSDGNHTYYNHKNGIDIILTMDISRSMLDTDFYPSRIEVAKKVAKEFVDARSNDRIGLVAYAGEAFTACPATTDYNALKKQINALHCGMNIEPGTAIGIGLGTAVTRLRNDSIPSKVIILITDGSNNTGTISPLEAADLAKAKNVKVYTIGMGIPKSATKSNHFLISPDNEPELDETTLKEIARKTKGKYFNASNEQALRSIYAEIEKMEKRIIIDRYFQKEPPANPDKLLGLAVFLMMIGWGIPHFLFWTHD